MRIGILGAMPEEIDLLAVELRKEEETTIGRRQYLAGKLFDQDAVIVFSRWGKVASASTVTTLIDHFGVGMIIFTGVAGAVSEELEIGDIVVASELVQHDLDASAIPPFQRFEVPLLGVTHLQVAADTVEQVGRAAREYLTKQIASDIGPETLAEFNIAHPKVVIGTIASGDQFIADPEKVARLRLDIPNLKCVEMEGAAVAQVCHEHDIPFMVMRAISDKADHSAKIDFTKFLNRIASHYTRGVIRNFLAG